MIEEGQEIEQELPVAETVETPATPSIRESLASALEESKAKHDAQEPVLKAPVEVKSGRERDEAGKFAKEPSLPKNKKDTRETSPVEAPVAMPKSFKSDMVQEWSKLPKPVQEQLAKREEDYHKELTKHDEERVFARNLREMANPYLPVIKAEGGDITKAFGAFLNTAYQLRTATPQAKGQLLLQLAQQFGADLRGASQMQTQVNPQLQGLQQQVQSLQHVIEQEKAFKKQQEDDALQSQITAFAADPKYPHFEAVRADMAALLRGGIAKDMPDAYDRAIYANPHTRSTLLTANTDAVNEQRVANQKAKAEAAKKAGSSLRGAPGIAASKNGRIIQPDLRSELRAQFAAHRDG